MKAMFSGTRNVKKSAVEFLKKHGYNPDSVSGELEYKGESSKFKISSQGVFTMVSNTCEELLTAIRSATKIIEA